MNNPAVSNLAFGLLGLLARGALSGYDLAGKLKMPVGFFWQARHSQIYPELAKLAARGLVRERVVVQQGRPNKKVYTLTASGKAALTAWITEPPARAPSRDELLLKTYSLWLADPRQALALFEAEAQRHQAQLAQYQGFQKKMKHSREEQLADAGTPDFATYATLLRGIGHERTYLTWCRWMIKSLRQRSPATAARRRRRRPARQTLV